MKTILKALTMYQLEAVTDTGCVCVCTRVRACSVWISISWNTKHYTFFWTLPTCAATTSVTYLVEIMLREFICDSEQVTTCVRVSERADAEAVGRIELSLEELTTNVLNLSEL